MRGSRGQVLYKSSAGTHAAGLSMMGCTDAYAVQYLILVVWSINAVGSRDMVRLWE